MKKKHCFDKHTVRICFSTPTIIPGLLAEDSSFSAPETSSSTRGVPGAAHTKGMTNFSISQTPAAQAKRNPSGPEIVTPLAQTNALTAAELSR